jgi:hypothetical protein
MAGVRVAPFTDSERSTRCVGQTAPDDRFGGRSFTEGELAAGRAVVARRRAGLGSRRRGPGLTPGRVGFAPPRAVVARTRAGLGSRRRGPGLTPGRVGFAPPRAVAAHANARRGRGRARERATGMVARRRLGTAAPPEPQSARARSVLCLPGCRSPSKARPMCSSEAERACQAHPSAEEWGLVRYRVILQSTRHTDGPARSAGARHGTARRGAARHDTKPGPPVTATPVRSPLGPSTSARRPRGR